MNSSISYIANHLGRYGPLILFIMALVSLHPFKLKRELFVIGFVLDFFVNAVLKQLIKQRRPNKYKSNTIVSANYDTSREFKSRPSWPKGAEIKVHTYGMPSGHAESVSYCTTYIILAINNIYLTMSFLFFAIITCSQRVLNRRHYIDQVLAGILVGTSFSYFMYSISIMLIERKM